MSNATDAAVKLAAEHDIDLADVVGTGADGRITKGDVEAYVAGLTAEGAEGAEEELPEVAADAPEDEVEPETAVPAEADVFAQTPAGDETTADFLSQVQAAGSLQALIALGDQATDEAQRSAVRVRAKELLTK